MRPIGILGGTFDPIHHGHLRLALECLDGLQLEELRFIPSGVPPHRPAPVAAADARLAMLRLAVADQPGFLVDDRELRRPGPSYTVLTLTELRAEFGPQRPLCLLLGLDAFLGLPGWHRWQELSGLAHLVVVHRPGWIVPADGGEPGRLLRAAPDATAEAIAASPAGGVWHRAVTQLEISATAIRAACRTGLSPRFLLPEAVRAFIDQNRIYR